MQRHFSTLKSSTFFLLQLVAVLLMQGHVFAQMPDALFSVKEEGDLTNTYSPASSWDDDRFRHGAPLCETVTNSHGEASGDSLTFTSDVSVAGDFDSVDQNCIASSGHTTTVYIKGKPTVTVVTAGSGDISLSLAGSGFCQLPDASDVNLEGGGSDASHNL